MSRSVAIPAVKPLGSLIPPVVSTSDYILDRTSVELITQQTTYSYSSAPRIVFDIDSDNCFWNPSDSWIRLDLTTSCKVNGGPDLLAYVCEGGIHAFMKHFTWEVRGQTQVLRTVRANELYAMFSNLHDSPEFVDRVLAKSGDSIGYHYNVDLRTRVFPNPGGMSYVDATQTWTLPNDVVSTIGDMQVGDLITFATGGVLLTVRIVSILTPITFTTDRTGANMLVGALSYAALQKKITRVPSRALLANVSKFTIVFQPFNALSRSPQWIPLFALRGGLRFTIDLERDERVLKTSTIPSYTGNNATGFAFSYLIENPVYVLDLIQPNPSLMSEYIALYQTSGLDYQFTSFAYQLDAQLQSAATTMVNRFQVGKRSCRYVIQKITDPRMESTTTNKPVIRSPPNTTPFSNNDVGASSYYVDSMSQGLRAGLGELLFTVGSKRFPYANVITFKNNYAWEMMAVAERTLQTLQMSLYGRRFAPEDWAMVPLAKFDNLVSNKESFLMTGGAYNRDEATKFYIVIDLARDPTPWCGINLLSVPLQMEYVFDWGSQGGAYYLTNYGYGGYDANPDVGASTTIRYFHTWVCHDLLWSISEQGTVIRS